MLCDKRNVCIDHKNVIHCGKWISVVMSKWHSCSFSSGGLLQRMVDAMNYTLAEYFPFDQTKQQNQFNAQSTAHVYSVNSDRNNNNGMSCVVFSSHKKDSGILHFYDTQERFSNERYPVESLLFACENGFHFVADLENDMYHESCKIFVLSALINN